MKKSFLALSFAALLFAGCNPDGNDKIKPLDATFTFAEESVELVYGTPAVISGTAVTAASLDEVVLTAVKQVGQGYEAVGEAQHSNADGLEIAAEFFADAKDLTAVELTLVSGKQSKSFYLPATVSGEALGTAWTNDAMVLYADNKVAHNLNDNVTYPVENTGAGSDTKSFFSMHGVEINGKVEHVLSLNELLEVDGLNASMCWLNCLEKTDAQPKADGSMTFIGGQRGYMFSGMRAASLGGGTTGRQCDIANYGGKQIKDANIDYDFSFAVINGSWIGEKYDEAKYKLVDRIWLSVPDVVETNLEKIKAFWALKMIQEELDNSKLGVEENPTSLGGKTYLRRWAEAGHTSTKALVENFRAGDYIVIRSERKEGEGDAAISKYYYGIIQVLQLPDDSATFVEKADGSKKYIDQEKAYDLFMKPAYFAVKTQCEIL